MILLGILETDEEATKKEWEKRAKSVLVREVVSLGAAVHRGTRACLCFESGQVRCVRVCVSVGLLAAVILGGNSV